MLPQELIQLPADALIVLKAGTPPIRGRKIVYHRERAFSARVLPPPVVAPNAAPQDGAADDIDLPQGPADPLTIASLVPRLASAGLEPLPPTGASPEAVEAWVERFIDASAQTPALETLHER